MLIIGELINCTRKRVGAAAQSRDAELIKEIALNQVNAGADLLDINGGLPGQEVECLPWLVKVVQEVVDVPLCLDSANPEALRRALPLCKHNAMINSITDQAARYSAVFPLVKEYKAKVIALCMGESGPPSNLEARVTTGYRLVDKLTTDGIPLDDIYVDVCVMPISLDLTQGKAIAEAIGQVTTRYPGVHTSAGVSNVSFGLPVRKLLNEAFLVLLMARGLDAAVVDPCDPQLVRNIRAAEALLGRDKLCANYLRAYREGKLESPATQSSAPPPQS
jgi:5-methyltetrahydrofolate--homocysteine methyltransferase